MVSRFLCRQVAPKRVSCRAIFGYEYETYNAGAEAMIAALHLLAAQPGTRRIAVLGTMKELGDQSMALHRYVGETVAALNLDQSIDSGRS